MMNISLKFNPVLTPAPPQVGIFFLEKKLMNNKYLYQIFLIITLYQVLDSLCIEA